MEGKWRCCFVFRILDKEFGKEKAEVKAVFLKQL